ncbi:MAG TPA: hypothetical protein PLL20_21075 [Phycisphaerae bacterium]|nr:hypothetical protein [Phycisphaerae bacterium]HRR87079.1 hypothetical protein [Phycisphaerae bacterium]
MTCGRTLGVCAGLIVAGLGGWAILDLAANAQTLPANAPAEAKSSVRLPEPQNVTLTGRLVDVHSFMTDKYPDADRGKTTADRLKAGVPAGLDTPAGLILLGTGAKYSPDKLIPLAYQEVEVKGKRYYRRGVWYLEFTSINKAKAADTTGLPAKPATVRDQPASAPASS